MASSTPAANTRPRYRRHRGTATPQSRTIDECLCLPGTSFSTGSGASRSTGTHTLGAALINDAKKSLHQQHPGRRLPERLVAAPHLVDGLYAEVKDDLQGVDYSLGDIAPYRLQAATNRKLEYPVRSNPLHLDETTVVYTDTTDIIDPAVAAVQSLEEEIGDNNPVTVHARSSHPKIDTVIRGMDPSGAEISLLIFEHKSKAVGEHLANFHYAWQLATNQAALNYNVSLASDEPRRDSASAPSRP